MISTSRVGRLNQEPDHEIFQCGVDSRVAFANRSCLGESDAARIVQVPEIRSSWNDLTDRIETQADWHKRRAVLKQRIISICFAISTSRRSHRWLQIHEDVIVDGVYRRS